MRLGYRPELDAVRGAAIALVLVQHFLFRGQQEDRNATAGIFGVTLFFVLSGYLITSLLIAERRATGTVSLSAFYVRRLRRLYPALIVMVAVVALLGLYGNSLVALVYMTYWAVRSGVDMGYLGHTWTLGIEEQFYLVWPLAFLLLARTPRAMVAALVALVAWSFLFRNQLGGLMRADALGAGALLAMWGGRLPRWAGAIGWFGIVALIGIHGDPVPLWLSSAATVTSVLIVASAAVPSWRWLIYLGTISYGVYLWHYPIARVIGSNVALLPMWMQLAAGFAGLALSLAAAIVSERWAERRFRRRTLERGALVEHAEVESAGNDRRYAAPAG